MRGFHMAALAAGVSLAAGASQAATYQYLDNLGQGQARTYVFENAGPGFQIDMIVFGDILHIFPDHITTTPYEVAVGANQPGYRETDADPFGKIDIFVALNNQTLTLRAENRIVDITGCLPSSPFVCGSSFEPAVVSVVLASANAGPSVTSAAVPEPGVWALMIAGFGLVGASLRGRRRLAA
jgi:hypothetical protein